MAKSASAMREYRKSQAKSKYANEAASKNETTQENVYAGAKKQVKGEAVSAVADRVEYEVYRYIEGKEVQMKNKDGSVMIRTGKQIREKMIYNKNRKGWISNAGGHKYIIRKR